MFTFRNPFFCSWLNFFPSQNLHTFLQKKQLRNVCVSILITNNYACSPHCQIKKNCKILQTDKKNNKIQSIFSSQNYVDWFFKLCSSTLWKFVFFFVIVFFCYQLLGLDQCVHLCGWGNSQLRQWMLGL